jgi:hypothetical protein
MLIKKSLIVILSMLTAGLSAQVIEPEEIIEDEAEDTVRFKRNCVEIYYSRDNENRFIYTDHGIFDGQDEKYKNGITRSQTIGFALTHYTRKNLAVSAGIELSGKTVSTGTLYFTNDRDVSAKYTNSISYLNFPVGIKYAVGKKLRAGAYFGAAFKYKISDGGDFFKVFPNGSSGNVPPYGWVNPFPQGKKDRVNLDTRFGIFLEYNFKRSKLRIMPVIRYDVFNTFHGNNFKNATSKGIAFEISL